MTEGGETIVNLLGEDSGFYVVLSIQKGFNCGRIFMGTPNCDWLHRWWGGIYWVLWD